MKTLKLFEVFTLVHIHSMSFELGRCTSLDEKFERIAVNTPPPRLSDDPVSHLSLRKTLKDESKYSADLCDSLSHVSDKAIISHSHDDDEQKTMMRRFDNKGQFSMGPFGTAYVSS